MIWYAVEIMFFLIVSLLAVMLYRCLLYSRSFNRFVETTFHPLQQPEQIEAAIESVQADAASFVENTSAEVERKAAVVRRVRKFKPKFHPQT